MTHGEGRGVKRGEEIKGRTCLRCNPRLRAEHCITGAGPGWLGVQDLNGFNCHDKNIYVGM